MTKAAQVGKGIMHIIVHFVIGVLIIACQAENSAPPPSSQKAQIEEKTESPVESSKAEKKPVAQGKSGGENETIGTSMPKGLSQAAASRVVLVVVDTGRADATELFGAKYPTTPFLKELASQGITFKKVFSPSSWTAPAMYSIMTGLYPTEHGIVEGTTLGSIGRRKVRAQPVLPDEALTLAEVLKENGYTTFGINTNFHMNAKFGFAQGFDHYYGENFSFMPYANMIAESLAKEFQSSEKSFAWLQYFDPHFPYRPMPPWFDQWNDTKLKTVLDFSIGMITAYYRHQQDLDPNQPVDTKYVYPIIEMSRMISPNQHFISYGLQYLKWPPENDYARFLEIAYLSEIRNVDEAMKNALALLGIDDQALVIVTSDHGEEIFDHGWCGHRHSLYQELIHVPLVIRLPGKAKAGTVVDTPASLIDVFPTILDLLNLPIPKKLSGVSLVPLIEGKEIAPRPLYLEVNNRGGEERALVDYPWKLVLNMTKKTTNLYNLEDDPKEKVNLIKEQAKRADDMRRHLLNWVEKTKPRWTAQRSDVLSQQEIQQLKKMGYLH